MLERIAGFAGFGPESAAGFAAGTCPKSLKGSLCGCNMKAEKGSSARVALPGLLL